MPAQSLEATWGKKKPPVGSSIAAMATEKPMVLTAIAHRAAIPIADKAVFSRSIIARQIFQTNVNRGFSLILGDKYWEKHRGLRLLL